MGTELVNAIRNLPTTLTGDVERLGYSMLRALDRLGFIHERKDGATFAIRFDAVRVYGSTWAAYHVDAERLYHFSVSDLSRPSVLAQLAAVIKRPVRAFGDGGMAYVVELEPKPKTRLPGHATLDLSTKQDGALLVPLGVGRAGPIWRELRDIGHAMIAGTSGAGKSNFLHVALAGLLSLVGPDRLRVALIDPKRHELTAWVGAPHLLADIAYTPEQAAELLSDLCQEVNRRSDLLAGALVRDLAAYNRKATEPLPHILVVIDECLDLTDEKRVMGPLKTLAILGRSAGVFVWAATQHAAAITGMPRVVNINLSSRFVFRVVDGNAAQVAGCSGAEGIPRDRPGRMLAKIDTAPVELQGFYLNDDELLTVTRKLAGNQTRQESLPEEEGELVRYAVDALDGFFVVNRVALAFKFEGWTSHKVKMLAQSWERKGWLLPAESATVGRKVTNRLCELAGIIAQDDAREPHTRNSHDCEL